MSRSFTRPLTGSPAGALGAGEGEQCSTLGHPCSAIRHLPVSLCVVDFALTRPGAGSVRSFGNVFFGRSGPHRASPLTSSRQPASRIEPWPQWPQRSPTSGPAPIANLTPKIMPPRSSTRSPSIGRVLGPRPGSSRFPRSIARQCRKPGSLNRPPACPSPKPGRWSPACLCGDSPTTVRRGRCHRRGHHRRRDRRPTKPRCRPRRPDASHSGDPAACHRRGQGEWLRSSHRAGDGPPGRLRELGCHLHRGAPQALRSCAVVRMLVREPGWPTSGRPLAHSSFPITGAQRCP